MESKIFINSEVVANQSGKEEVANNPTVVKESNALDIMKEVLGQIERWQKNAPLVVTNKMDKFSAPIYADLMSKWLDKKRLAQHPEQMLEVALRLENEWLFSRNADRRLRDMITGGFLLMDEFLAQEIFTDDKYWNNAALIVCRYIGSVIVQSAKDNLYVRDVLWEKKGSGKRANLSEIVAALYSYWQAADAAIDSLNSEIKILLKNAVKSRNV